MFDLMCTKFIAGPAITIMQSNNSVFSCILEGTTERYYNFRGRHRKVLQFIMALEQFYSKNFCFNVQKDIFNSAEMINL